MQQELKGIFKQVEKQVALKTGPWKLYYVRNRKKKTEEK